MRTEATSADQRTPLIVVSGLQQEQVREVARTLHRQSPRNTALLHHDLRHIGEGIVRRTLRRGSTEQRAVLELAHGCVSCTLREDLLPLLRELAADSDVDRIVVELDPAVEPEAVCWALQHVVVNGGTAVDDARIEAVVTVVDLPTWLADAGGDEMLTERGLPGSPDDERTVAQLAVGQVEFADALVLSGDDTDHWNTVRTHAVLDRLAPTAPRARLADFNPTALLNRIPANSRRGEVDGPHGRLLRGQPPLEPDAGVSVVVFHERRPFHPGRLHDALDVLLDGVVRTRGRAWVASQPDAVLWLESAGGGLNVGHAGPWLAALPLEQWTDVDPEQQTKALLAWDDYYGDRMQELVVIAHRADPEEITRALRAALLTDEELAAGQQQWLHYPDPFSDWHTDPCADPDVDEMSGAIADGDIAKEKP